MAATLARTLFLVEPTGFLLHFLTTVLLHLGENKATLRIAHESGFLEKSPIAVDAVIRIAIDAGAVEIARQVQEEFPTENKALISYLKESEMLSAIPRERGCTVLVVSLEHDVYRRAACCRILDALGVSYRIIDAVGPGNVPSELLRLVEREGEIDFSSLGKVSHLLCWQAIIDASLDIALVIEDDAVLRGWPGIAVDLADLGGFDFLFVNDRLTPSQECCTSVAAFGAVPVVDALIDIASRNPKLNAPGSDAYLVSNAAARKLVDIVNATGFPSRGADWCLLIWAVSRHEAEEIPESIIRDVLSQKRPPGVEVRSLNAGTTTRPLALHRPVGVWRDTRVY